MIGSQEVIVPTKEKVRAPEIRIQAFNTFSEAFEPKLNVIYYPGSHTDMSPSKTLSFQNSRIIYVDRDNNAIQTLRREGCEAYLKDAKKFNPGKVDLLLLFNFYTEEPLKYVVKNGYVICNGHWSGTVDKILRQNDFELAGVFTDENQTLRTDEEALRINSQIKSPSKVKAENLFVFRKK